MALGYVVGRVFKIDSKSVATLAVFVFSPVVFMLSIQKLDFYAGAIGIPVLIAFMCTLLSLVVLTITKTFLNGKTPYLSALMSGTSNWGYFGIPIAFVLFEPEVTAIYILIGFGTHLFENSFGIYYASRGDHSPLESIKNIFKFPVIYAIIIGFILSYLQYEPPYLGENFFDYMKGAYVVLGMMLVGLGLADMDRFSVDIKFVSTVFSVRFLIWPCLALLLIWLDSNILNMLGENFYGPILLFSAMPMGANNIAFAAKFNMNPGKASVAALATTFFAMLYVPFFLNIVLK